MNQWISTISMRPRMIATIACLWLIIAGCVVPAAVQAGDKPALSRGQTVYVPVYSHIYAGDSENPIYLAATISVRNTDRDSAITVTAADYYNSKGQKIKSYLKKPEALNALSSIRYVVKESDKVGGSGANFIVSWRSDRPVNPPLIESVMISTRSALGISFSSRGQVISTSK